MKTSILIFSFVSLAVLSCKKEEPTPTPSTPTTPVLKSFFFKMNGSDKNLSSTISQHTSGLILISGSTQPNETINLRMQDTIQAGSSYDFSPNGAFRLFYTPDNYLNSYTSVSGSANVVTYNTSTRNVSGTFSCVLVGNQTTPDTIIVSNGEFNFTYPQ